MAGFCNASVMSDYELSEPDPSLLTSLFPGSASSLITYAGNGIPHADSKI